MKEIEICYSDEHFIVVNKPAKMLVHKTKMDKGERITLMQLISQQLGRKVYPVHRLDKATSGVLICSFDAKTSEYFRCVFEEKRIQKEYIAVCRGWITDSLRVNHPVKKSTLTSFVEAETHFEPIATTLFDVPVGPYEQSRYSLVKAIPQTGRWHQIRQHCNHLRHPIAGDKRHGDYRHNNMFVEQFDCDNILLHAAKVSFVHPYSSDIVEVRASLPAHWDPVLKAFGWDKLPDIQYLTPEI